MICRRWLFAILLAGLADSQLVGCSSKPPEQPSVDREAIRQQQIQRANRESGGN
jgi:hypothetical protein